MRLPRDRASRVRRVWHQSLHPRVSHLQVNHTFAACTTIDFGVVEGRTGRPLLARYYPTVLAEALVHVARAIHSAWGAALRLCEPHLLALDVPIRPKWVVLADRPQMTAGEDVALIVGAAIAGQGATTLVRRACGLIRPGSNLGLRLPHATPADAAVLIRIVHALANGPGLQWLAAVAPTLGGIGLACQAGRCAARALVAIEVALCEAIGPVWSVLTHVHLVLHCRGPVHGVGTQRTSDPALQADRLRRICGGSRLCDLLSPHR
mmetsp:Transcript_11358/g.23849  ORF Transcript_11358/g.23849 Transcript_11358/m.23849 type:complete len:264 (+) Transcript_11358:171-962(+)